MNRLSMIACLLAVFLITLSCAPCQEGESSQPRLEVGEVVIVPGSGGLGPFISLDAGTLVLGRGDEGLQSSDGGDSFVRRSPLPRSLLLRLRDGSFYALQGRAPTAEEAATFVGRAIWLETLADLDGAKWEEVSLSVPRWVAMTDDTGAELPMLNIYGPLLELDDGTLLLGTYGNFVGDTVPMGGFIADRGQRWERSRRC